MIMLRGLVIDPVGDGLAQTLVREVLGPDFFRLTFGLPLPAARLEIPEVFLLFRVHRHRRLLPLLKGQHLAVDELELGVSVGVCTLSEDLRDMAPIGSINSCLGCRIPPPGGGQVARASSRCTSPRIFALLGRPARADLISPANTSRCNALRL